MVQGPRVLMREERLVRGKGKNRDAMGEKKNKCDTNASKGSVALENKTQIGMWILNIWLLTCILYFDSYKEFFLP